jgi:hypothetical protein
VDGEVSSLHNVTVRQSALKVKVYPNSQGKKEKGHAMQTEPFRPDSLQTHL